MSVPTQARQVGVKEETWVLTGTIPATGKAGDTIALTIKRSPGSAGKEEYNVPSNQVWIINSVYGKGAPAVDGLVQFFVNDTKVAEVIASLIDRTLQNPKDLPKVIKAAPTALVAAKYVLLEDNTSGADQTVTIYANVTVVSA